MSNDNSLYHLIQQIDDKYNYDIHLSETKYREFIARNIMIERKKTIELFLWVYDTFKTTPTAHVTEKLSRIFSQTDIKIAHENNIYNVKKYAFLDRKKNEFKKEVNKSFVKYFSRFVKEKNSENNELKNLRKKHDELEDSVFKILIDSLKLLRNSHVNEYVKKNSKQYLVTSDMANTVVGKTFNNLIDASFEPCDIKDKGIGLTPKLIKSNSIEYIYINDKNRLQLNFDENLTKKRKIDEIENDDNEPLFKRTKFEDSNIKQILTTLSPTPPENLDSVPTQISKQYSIPPKTADQTKKHIKDFKYLNKSFLKDFNINEFKHQQDVLNEIEKCSKLTSLMINSNLPTNIDPVVKDSVIRKLTELSNSRDKNITKKNKDYNEFRKKIEEYKEKSFENFINNILNSF